MFEEVENHLKSETYSYIVEIIKIQTNHNKFELINSKEMSEIGRILFI